MQSLKTYLVFAVISFLIFGCSDESDLNICQYDQDCNDNPSISALWGSCNEDGSCSCIDGMEINPETGKCWPVIEMPCQYDQDCNDNPSISALWGSCNEDGSCSCIDGMEINPVTGKCRLLE